MSTERVAVDLLKANWDKRIEVLTLKNQGWTFQQIADKHKTSKQAVQTMHSKMKDMTVQEIEEKYKSLLLG